MILLKLTNKSTNLGKSEGVKMPETKNEPISLWILEQKRQENRSKAQKELAQRAQIDAVDDNYQCLKCKKPFDEPKLVQYYACPHCLSKLEEKVKIGCQYWFGFLSEKDKSESIPQECIECEKVMACMLHQNYDSPNPVSEIEKWY